MSASKKYFTKESRIGLIGGGGYLGTQFYNNLKAQNFKHVIRASRNASGEDFVMLDLLQDNAVSALKELELDFVFNLTGQITNPLTSCLKLNTIGINNLLSACKDNSVLIQLSTVNVYGTQTDVDETTECKPETAYATLKLTAEELIKEKLDPSEYLIVRLSNLYGGDQTKGIFSYLKNSARNGKELYFNNNGSLTRSFIHVDDMSRGLIELCQKTPWEDSNVFNFVGKETFTVKELIQIFEKQFKVIFKTEFDPYPPYDNTIKISDEKFRRITGFQEVFDLEGYINKLSQNDH